MLKTWMPKNHPKPTKIPLYKLDHYSKFSRYGEESFSP